MENVKIENEGLIKMLKWIAQASGQTLDEFVQKELICSIAKKQYYSDRYGKPEPIASCMVRGADGKLLDGDELFKDCYMQAQGFWQCVETTFQACNLYILVLEGKIKFEDLETEKQTTLMERYPGKFEHGYVQ